MLDNQESKEFEQKGDLSNKVEDSIRKVFLRRWPHTQVAPSLIEELVAATLRDKVMQGLFLEVKYKGLYSTREKIKSLEEQLTTTQQALDSAVEALNSPKLIEEICKEFRFEYFPDGTFSNEDEVAQGIVDLIKPQFEALASISGKE